MHHFGKIILKSLSINFNSCGRPNDKEFNNNLRTGSDDGMKVWVNGELVSSIHLIRAMRVDEDLVPIKLLNGKNIIVVKVVQGVGGWRFAVRLLDPEKITKIDLN